MNEFSSLLEKSHNFLLRRGMERLREGLFDPFAVQLLTAGETKLARAFEKGVTAVAKNEPARLQICGSYGQGKSHSLTWIREHALQKGFVVSLINLDPREIPFHDFRQVYRALMAAIRFPGSNDNLVQFWKTWSNDHQGALDSIPDSMPHFFRSVLTALTSKNIPLTRKQKRLKKHSTFRPREFPWILANALKGEQLPVFRLRHALKYRDVPFYKDASLVCKGWEPYLQAMYSFAELFQNMGFKGWVVLFDEGESIGQRPVNIRRKSYTILDQIFVPARPVRGLYPIFAFTDEFFLQVQEEDYERVFTKQEQEFPYFEKNYGRSWQQIPRHHLHDLAASDWQDIISKLIRLHAAAYGWQPQEDEIRKQMQTALKKAGTQEARLKIKTLVALLDIAQQKNV